MRSGGFAFRSAATAATMAALVHCVGSDPLLVASTPDAAAPPGDASAVADGGGDEADSAGLPPAPEGRFTRSFVMTPSLGGAPMVAADGTGNVYFAIAYSKQGITIGDRPTLTTGAFSNTDIAIAKVTPDGAVVNWVSTVTGNDSETVMGITTDDAGAVYVAGLFESDAIQVGSESLPRGAAPTSFFITKLRADDGVAEWTKVFAVAPGQASTGAGARGGVIRATPKGQLAFSCSFRGELDLSPRPPVSFSSFVGSVVGILGPSGDFVSSQTIASDLSGPPDAGGGSRVVVRDVHVDRDDNFFLVGETTMPALTVGTKQLPSSGNAADSSGFAMELAPGLGSERWHRVFGGKARGGTTAFVRAALAGPSAYVLGTYAGSSDFGFGPTPVSDAGTTDLVLLKLEPGGTPAWVKTFGGPTQDDVGGVAVDRWGRPFFTAALQNLENTTIEGRALPNGQVFLVAKVDPKTGELLYVNASAGGTSASSVVALPNGHGLVAGGFQGAITLETPQTGATGAFISGVSP